MLIKKRSEARKSWQSWTHWWKSHYSSCFILFRIINVFQWKKKNIKNYKEQQCINSTGNQRRGMFHDLTVDSQWPQMGRNTTRSSCGLMYHPCCFIKKLQSTTGDAMGPQLKNLDQGSNSNHLTCYLCDLGQI